MTPRRRKHQKALLRELSQKNNQVLEEIPIELIELTSDDIDIEIIKDKEENIKQKDSEKTYIEEKIPVEKKSIKAKK